MQIAKIMNEVKEGNPIVSVQAASRKANHDDEGANNDKREKQVEKENCTKALVVYNAKTKKSSRITGIN
jgi:hypothetical protein